jgi:DNA-directed RNA polymerase sigma subunit (sigma70/sigma32)
MGTALVMGKRLEELIATGMRKGYVLYDEIDDLLPEDYSDGPEIDDILSELDRADIEIVDEPGIGGDVAQPEVHDPTNPVDVYLREVGTLPQLTPAVEMDLVKRMQGSGEEAEIARKDLLEPNLQMVGSVAKRNANGNIHILDLIMHGNNALLKATYKFNPSRSYRFSTFAEWFVRRAIRRESRR